MPSSDVSSSDVFVAVFLNSHFRNDELTIYSLNGVGEKHNLITSITRCDEMFYIISDLLRENSVKHALPNVPKKQSKKICPCHKSDLKLLLRKLLEVFFAI